MIPLPCPHCGACVVPVCGPGTSPHAAALMNAKEGVD